MKRSTQITVDVAEAARCLQGGGLVAFPTETVYGLGANALLAEAVADIFRAKGRPQDNPLIVHVADLDSVTGVAAEVPGVAWTLLERFAPGPLTVVLRRGAGVAQAVSAGLDTVAVRIPSHPLTLELLRACHIPIAAPSANRSGRPSATTWQAVQQDLDGRIDLILKGEQSSMGLESTVVDCTGPVPVILRRGGISLEELQRAVPETRTHGGRSEASPGTRHRHYAPAARVVVVGGPADQPEATWAYIGLDSPPEGYRLVRHCRDVPEYAHALYDFFRSCDAAGIERLDCQAVPATGLGAALMDRLERAQEATLNGR